MCNIIFMLNVKSYYFVKLSNGIRMMNHYLYKSSRISSYI